jgi:hypothetical protein
MTFLQLSFTLSLSPPSGVWLNDRQLWSPAGTQRPCNIIITPFTLRTRENACYNDNGDDGIALRVFVSGFLFLNLVRKQWKITESTSSNTKECPNEPMDIFRLLAHAWFVFACVCV